MATQVVTETGWFGRIGGALKGILVGMILLVVGVVMLVLNERDAVRDISANNEIAEKVVGISIETPDPANEGKLVHLNGPAVTQDKVTNETFGIEENAIRLEWDAKIYQWVEKQETKTEKKLGGGEKKVTTYSYEKQWVSKPVDSSKFQEKDRVNKADRKFQSGSNQAGTVTLGGFRLPDGLISKIGGSSKYPLEEIPSALSSTSTIQDGVFYSGNPSDPQIGDEKVSFQLVQPTDVTVMAVQTGNSFKPYVANNGKEKFLLETGILTAAEIVEVERGKAKMLRWILRFGGWLLLMIGFNLILRPLSVLADVVPFIGNLVGGATGVISFLLSLLIASVVIAISWIFFRPLIAIPLLLVAGACIVLIVKKVLAANKGPATGAA